LKNRKKKLSPPTEEVKTETVVEKPTQEAQVKPTESPKVEELIYTTKQPNMWQTQLGQERGAKSPEYLYLAEVKNPSKESSYYGHETASPVNEVKIVKKLGKDLELTKGKDEPVDLGGLEVLREQYAKENNIPLENIEYHWSNKPDLIKQPKPETKVEKPVEMPEEIATEFLNEIDSMIGQVKSASRESQGTSFTRENIGKGYEVTNAVSGFTYSDFPEWFSRLGKSKGEILNALEKIKNGETEGKLVFQLREIATEHLTEGQEIATNLFSKGEKKKQVQGQVPPNEKVSMFGKQVGFENLAKAKFPETAIKSQRDKGTTGSPLFEQKSEVRGQTDIFDWIFDTDKSRQNIREAGSNLQAGIDPTLLKDYAVVGLDYMRKGLNNYSKWQEQMVKEFGSEIKPLTY